MMFFGLVLISTFAIALPHSSNPPLIVPEPLVSYDGYHVYSITPSSMSEAITLKDRFDGYHTHATHNALSVAIPPSEIAAFNSMGISATLVNSDLGNYMRNTDKISTYSDAMRRRGELPDLSWFDSYHDYADHLQYWDDLVDAFGANGNKIDIGKSYEGRPIYAFHFMGRGNESTPQKPVILWHATVHAREWISTMVIEYLAYRLIDGYTSGDANVTSFLDYYDFYLVPFHNPDGFVYTQTNDRLWRKNRQPRPTTNSRCIGTDGNRNWKFQWAAEPPGGGASPNPCSETYRGLAPGDTPENQALDGLSANITRGGQAIRSFIDFHSYSQLVLTPYGYTCDTLPETLPRMLEVAGGTARAIETASEIGSAYEFGPGCEILYFSTGNSRDHHYAMYGANHSWTIELSPRDELGGGFVLPPEKIWPVVKEQWQGQLWLLNNVREN